MATLGVQKLSSRPGVNNMELEFSKQKDEIYRKIVMEYLLLLLQDIYDNGDIELANLLQDSSVRILASGHAYSKKDNTILSPYFNEKATEKIAVRVKGLTPVISINGAGSNAKWIDLSLVISLKDGNQICTQKYTKLVESLKRIDELRKNPPPKPMRKSIVALQVAVVDDIVTALQSNNEISSLESEIPKLTSLLAPPETVSPEPKSIEKSSLSVSTDLKIEEHASKVTIPDQLLNILLYSFKSDSSLETVNGKNLYFIPETSVDAILRGGTVFGLGKQFITETVIRGNLPLAFARRKGSFRTVIRTDKNQYDEKKDSYDAATLDQMELLIAGLDVYQVGDKLVQYISHNIEDLRIAMEETGASDESIRSFYGAVNAGGSAKLPTIRKGYLFTLPPDFNEAAYEEEALKSLTDIQLVDRISIINEQLKILNEKNETDVELINTLKKDIGEIQERLENKRAMLSGTKNQLEELRSRTIKNLNIYDNIPDNASIELMRELILRRIHFLQNIETELATISIASLEQSGIISKIREEEESMQRSEENITMLSLLIESNNTTIAALEKENSILIHDKERRKNELRRQLAMFD